MSDFIAIHQQLPSIGHKLDRLLEGEGIIVSDLDDVTARIEADEATNEATLAELRSEIQNLADSGADVTRLQAVAAKLEASDAPPAAPVFNPADASYATWEAEQEALFTYNAGKPENEQAPSLSFDEVNAARAAAGLENFPEDQRPAA